MDKRIVLSNLDYKRVLHENDKRLLDKLEKIPGFRKLIESTVVKLQGKILGVEYQGNGYDINEGSAPSIYQSLSYDCKILGLTPTPRFSSLWSYAISSFSVGGNPKRIVLSSGAIDLLPNLELDFLAGHEIGHILCGHIPYQMVVELLYSPLINESDPQLSALASVIKLPMLDWYRNSHLSADRMGLLCCQDIDTCLKVMMKMGGVPIKYFDKVNTKQFLYQGELFEEMTKETFNRLISNMSVKAASSPWMVRRAAELYKWYKSGEYEAILKDQ